MMMLSFVVVRWRAVGHALVSRYGSQ